MKGSRILPVRVNVTFFGIYNVPIYIVSVLATLFSCGYETI